MTELLEQSNTTQLAELESVIERGLQDFLRRGIAVLPLALLALLGARQSGTAQRVDVATELATTIGDGFTMASAGDLIAAYPSTSTADPRYKALMTIVQNADVATANWEASVIDGRKFKGSSIGPQAGTPDVPRT